MKVEVGNDGDVNGDGNGDGDDDGDDDNVKSARIDSFQSMI